MIPIQDLRVGGVFTRELRTSRGIEYEHDFILTEEWMGKLFGDDISIALQDLTPILLSSEVLLSVGFERKEENMGSGVVDVHYELDGHWLYLFKNGFEFEYTVPNVGRFNLFRKFPPYLHQLMNLYYALCGKEINYKQK